MTAAGGRDLSLSGHRPVGHVFCLTIREKISVDEADLSVIA